MEQRVRLGGLGGPADEAVWDKSLQQAKTIQEFVSVHRDFGVHVYVWVHCMLLNMKACIIGAEHYS